MFKKHTGIHLTRYIARTRIEQARALLMNPNYRVSEIAFDVGFQSLTHYSRIFKSISGRSSSDYRDHLQKA